MARSSWQKRNRVVIGLLWESDRVRRMLCDLRRGTKRAGVPWYSESRTESRWPPVRQRCIFARPASVSRAISACAQGRGWSCGSWRTKAGGGGEIRKRGWALVVQKEAVVFRPNMALSSSSVTCDCRQGPRVMARVDVLRFSLKWVAESTARARQSSRAPQAQARREAEARSSYSTEPKKCGTICE